MRAQLRIEYLRSTPKNPARVALSGLIDHLDRQGLWVDYDVVTAGQGEDAPIPATPASRVAAASRNWSTGLYEAHAKVRRPRRGSVTLEVARDEVAVIQTVEGAALDERKDRLLDDWLAVVSDLSTFAPGSLGPTVGIVVTDIEFSRLRPPVQVEAVQEDAVADVFSKAFHGDSDLGDRSLIERVLGSQLPAGVSLEERGDLVIVRWISSLAIPEQEIGARLAEREGWVRATFEGAVRPGWNEQGDRVVQIPGLVEHAPLTLYDARGSEGFVAVTRAGATEDHLRELGKLRRAGRLADGTPLARLSLIVPSRKVALDIRETARKHGIDAVLYATDDGSWWEPPP